MSIQVVLALVAMGVLASLALIAAAPASGLAGRRSARRRTAETSQGSGLAPLEARPGNDPPMLDEVPPDVDLRPAALDRVIRVAIWVFLFVATTVVAVTGLWADREGPILAVLAVTAIYALVLHEIVPGRMPDSVVLVGEGILGLMFAGLLVALTGGSQSPFFFAFPLIVGGAALVVSPGATVALTAAAGAAYIAAVGLGSEPLTLAGGALAGVNLTALCLLAYVGTAIGREQRRAREDALRRATVDALTGLRTRSFMFAALERELIRSQRTGRRFCLLMIDLDDLKVINDRHGHMYGDRALRCVGDVIRAGTRRIDTGARFGGDEFVVLLPETDPTGGWVLAEKIRQGVAEAGIIVGDAAVATSVSVGLVTFPDDGETVGELLERADDAMYRSKRSGRDRVTGVPVMDAAGEADVEAASARLGIGRADAGGAQPAGSRRRPV